LAKSLYTKPVHAWMGDPLRDAASHRDQLSLAIRSWVGAMSTGISWEDNR